MGHIPSKEIVSDSSDRQSSRTLSLDNLSETFTFISQDTEDMSDKSKQKGKKVIDRALSITGEVRAEREMLEKKHPELKRVFLGFQHCNGELQKRDKESEKYFGEINKLLKEKVIVKFMNAEFAQDEQREVMGNKLAEIG